MMLASTIGEVVGKRTAALLYLRVAYFGWRMTGIEAACTRLGTSCREVSFAQVHRRSASGLGPASGRVVAQDMVRPSKRGARARSPDGRSGGWNAGDGRDNLLEGCWSSSMRS